MSTDEATEASMMPSVNGELNVPSSDTPAGAMTPGKRKRGSGSDETSAQETALPATEAQEKEKLQENLRNLVEVLSKNDTELHLLTCPLPTSPLKHRSKRTKVASDKDEAASIQERVVAGRYNTIQEFLGDIEKASSTAIEGSKSKPSSDEADGTPLTETVNRIAAFKKVLNSLVRQVQVNPSTVKAEPTDGDGETSAKPAPSTGDAKSDNTVLTLFGNPSNPKQLYSSLQKSVKVPLSSDGPESERYVEVQQPLRDIALPNGITATKVPQTKPESVSKPAKRTFGEVFASRASLPQLEPPRRARSSSRTTWVDAFDAMTNYRSFPGERNNYCLAPLPSGQWLQYGGVTSSPSYWSRRQKGDSDVVPKSYETPLSADEHPSLLQGVYSSFAPSFDSSGAVVQADSKDMVWWSKRGSKRLDSLLSLPYEDVAEEESSEQPGNIGDLDEQTLDEMVKSFKPEDFADGVTSSGETAPEKQDPESKEMEALLGDVSELLETLSSYQRVRNLETPASGNQTTSPNFGDANTPSATEKGIYETLKSSLSALVSNLPPYAVAKLDGDQLADLNISQKILIQNPDYRGTMEKDEYTLQHERLAALASMNSGHRSTPSVSSAGRPRNVQGYNRPYTSTQSFSTPQTYYGNRQPSTPGTYTPGHYASPRPTATPTQRPGYPAQYNQPTPNMQNFSRPGQNGYTTYAAQQTPGASAQASPQTYPPRPAQPGMAYNAPYGAARASSSPQKQPQYNSPQARVPYMTPGGAQPQPQQQQRFVQQQQHQQHQQQQQQQQQQQPTPYGGHSASQSATPQPSGYSNSAAAVTYARSAAEQAALMDRNKAQLAAANSRPPSSTPQPAGGAEHAGTSISRDQSGTPGSQPNGTPVQS